MITGKNISKKQIKQLAKKNPFQNKLIYDSLKHQAKVTQKHQVKHFDVLAVIK